MESSWKTATWRMKKYWAVTLTEMFSRFVAGKRSGQNWIGGLSSGWLWYWLQLKVHLCTVCVCAVSCVSVNVGGSTRLGSVGLCTGSFTRLRGLCIHNCTRLSGLCTDNCTRQQSVHRQLDKTERSAHRQLRLT
jgi:hypothetical protein